MAYENEFDKQCLERGKQLVMARNKGNCLACLVVDDGEFGGNIGAPLIYTL